MLLKKFNEFQRKGEEKSHQDDHEENISEKHVVKTGKSTASRGRRSKGGKLIQKTLPSWRQQFFTSPEKCPRFHPGTVDFSPGWFMNRHEVTIIIKFFWPRCLCPFRDFRIPL